MILNNEVHKTDKNCRKILGLISKNLIPKSKIESVELKTELIETKPIKDKNGNFWSTYKPTGNIFVNIKLKTN